MHGRSVCSVDMLRKHTPASAPASHQPSKCRHLRTTWFTSNPNGGQRRTKKQRNTGKRNLRKIVRLTNSTRVVTRIERPALIEFPTNSASNDPHESSSLLKRSQRPVTICPCSVFLHLSTLRISI